MKLIPRLSAVVIVASLAAPLHAAPPEGRETFTAFAVDMGGPRRRSGTSHVKITIDRWSSEAERRQLVSTFTESGTDAFLREMQKLKPLGRVSTPDSIGYDLHYAHQVPLASGGRRIFIATDRPISYWESVNRPRSIDYPYTVIEMRIGPDGKGQGKMNVATRVNAFGDTIELENYDFTPVHLTNIRASKK